MVSIQPFWFAQRQGKAEEISPNLLRLTGPNLRESYIGIQEIGGKWSAFLRASADGPDEAATSAELPTPYDAWEAAFELYRTHVVV